MAPRSCRARGRAGAVAVETAVVITLATSLIFGLFEYSRLLMDWQLLNNAAREGCRYALANNTGGSLESAVQTLVLKYMAGQTSSFENLTVTVTGSRNGVSTPVVNLSPGDPITVTVSGRFKFMNIIPLIRMPTNLTLKSSVTMLCEGGT